MYCETSPLSDELTSVGPTGFARAASTVSPYDPLERFVQQMALARREVSDVGENGAQAGSHGSGGAVSGRVSSRMAAITASRAAMARPSRASVGLAMSAGFPWPGQVAEADLDAGHRLGLDGGFDGIRGDFGHEDQAPAPGRGPSCPWVRPTPPFLPPPCYLLRSGPAATAVPTPIAARRMPYSCGPSDTRWRASNGSSAR